ARRMGAVLAFWPLAAAASAVRPPVGAIELARATSSPRRRCRSKRIRGPRITNETAILLGGVRGRQGALVARRMRPGDCDTVGEREAPSHRFGRCHAPLDRSGRGAADLALARPQRLTP